MRRWVLSDFDELDIENLVEEMSELC